ncbi:RNA recognition domain-containing protein [Colletotrichum phormii]|uniref:Pre-mRNA-splicing factor CWC2 n=1 Tax=Colletotrichum phormii TaxID=359342 RepID=A0AAJ0ENF1_9PEZI|nr:RNA recognition domain-containing protein [Colletotrichum phormii]KAK1655519.1 RNA recognition domain-containing protein [Colletotrichum phormii]
MSDEVAQARPEEVDGQEPEDNGQETALATTTTEVAAPTERKVKKIIRKKKRPARPQVDPSFITSEPPPQTGTIFNIWYNKWSGGDREDKYLSKTHAKGRCNVAKDSGYTRADKVTGSYFCLFFARGICPKGQDCEYLHRLPGIHDIFNPNVDCFGRDKHSDYRDDMGGVGSFMRQNRTIYVGRIHVTDDIEEIVARHFAEWGQVERVRVLNTRGVAFITYSNEANAQFAKEAMAHQSLDHEEILNVRWATADPNPMAQAREARRIEEQAAEAVRRALPAEFVAEIEGKDPEARKRRKIESSYGLEGYEAPDEVHFARGANAVNPVGREGHEMEYQERLLLESGGQGQYEGLPMLQQQPAVVSGGIFSSSTLAALNSSKVAVASKPKVAVSAGPLVGYGSDDDSN